MNFLANTPEIGKTHKTDENLTKAAEAIKLSLSISEPLAHSPSQNTPKRREIIEQLKIAHSNIASFAKKIKSMNWDEEIKIVNALIEATSALETDVQTKKSLSWDEIISKLESLQYELSHARKKVADRAEAESKILTEITTTKVAQFNPQELNEEIWETVSTITAEAANSGEKINSFPLAPLTPWNPKDDLQQSISSLDEKVAELAGPVANSVESVTISVGFQPHSGQRLALQAIKYKWIILGIIVGILFLKFHSKG